MIACECAFIHRMYCILCRIYPPPPQKKIEELKLRAGQRGGGGDGGTKGMLKRGTGAVISR